MGLGYVVSPRTLDGRPVLPLAGCAGRGRLPASGDGVATSLAELDIGLQAVLNAPDSGLLEQSRKAQASFEAADSVGARGGRDGHAADAAGAA